MIPKLDKQITLKPLYLDFLAELANSGFEGDIHSDYANRSVLSTDNSIYQILPQAVIHPKNISDLVHLAQLSNEPKFHAIVLSPRGGGTGTNGQSLTDGIVVDVSKHMNQILEINHAERWVRVQAGVVKDQLNAAIKPFGLFFAPELSTSNRATIGGMINTDASGQGSCQYGKTRDHVLELSTVLLDGTVLHSHPLSQEQFEARREEQNRSGLIHRLVDNIGKEHKTLIDAKFPKLNRCLTGYDLAHIHDRNGRLNLNNILCGSEGTLGFIAEAKLNILPIPKFSALIVVKYDNFDSALRDATRLMQAKPTSIETIDSKVLKLAMNDIVWHEVAEFFPQQEREVQGINLVEYTANDEQQLIDSLDALASQLADEPNEHCIGYSKAWGAKAVNRIWGMRKRAVGLLGNAQGEARPIPFVEDTAVPPEHLADFIAEFRALLDAKGLQYGMFGHVDAGVLHVRPAIDMKDKQQVKLVREISNQVAELTHKYHGLLWGEHGKGVRSEYAPKFFGELYPQLQRIKAAFDPRNQLNPGKIATPSKDHELLKIDAVPMRGDQERLIPVQMWESYPEAVYCNGNGTCYNWDFNDAMCPSWKATRERIHSPKGRATLIKEWLLQLSHAGFMASDLRPAELSFWQQLKQLPERWKNTRAKQRGEYDFSHEVHTAMMGCLACKSCVGQCPIKVDVPTFRSKFLALYYTRYLRPLKDYLVGSLEFLLPTLARMPGVYNFFVQAKPIRWILSRWVGFEDPPLLSSTSLKQLAKQHNIPLANQDNLSRIGAAQKKYSVVLVQDAFTSHYEAHLLVDICQLLRALGFTPLLAPFKPNGKPLHVNGFLHRFKKVATHQAKTLNAIARYGLPLVGIDPAMSLTYRLEYTKELNPKALPSVLLLQEFLAEHLQYIQQKRPDFKEADFKLLAHCTEKTNAAASMGAWVKVFKALGQNLEILSAGCCGMSGNYGHESQNRENSSTIFQQSWNGIVTNAHFQGHLLATGYSCRSQTQREAFVKLPHPLQALLRQKK